MPLGIREEPATVTCGKIAPGELLLLYTDGWTDMPDASGKPMGLQEFQRLVTQAWTESTLSSASDFIRRSAHALSRHAQTKAAADDRTFLAVRRLK